MNVLQVNYTDQLGKRFNGGALASWLNANGHQSRQAAALRQSPAGHTAPIVPPHLERAINSIAYRARKLEKVVGLDNVFCPQSFFFPFNSHFKSSDLVHYHIVHNHFFSYLALPWLSRLKPSVWSLHDPWALTGHCIHPINCEGWRTGCKPCPHLDYSFALRRDTAWLNFKLKDFAYRNSTMHIVVASQWMQRLVQQSPLMQHFPLHLIPFGLDLDLFKPANKSLAKAKLGIPDDRTVIGLRALDGPFKGLECSQQALDLLPGELPIHILTCQKKGMFAALAGKFPITELGEIEGDTNMVDFYNATDIHLMPSIAESFGMMAMEAAACGVPSVVFDGTPLPDVCFAPEGGLAIASGDVTALSRALHLLVSNDTLRCAMGARARVLAEANYSFDKYANAMLNLYNGILTPQTDTP